jgi:hypothetical protein
MLQLLRNISSREEMSFGDLFQDPAAQGFRNPYRYQLRGDW